MTTFWAFFGEYRGPKKAHAVLRYIEARAQMRLEELARVHYMAEAARIITQNTAHLIPGGAPYIDKPLLALLERGAAAKPKETEEEVIARFKRAFGGGESAEPI